MVTFKDILRWPYESPYTCTPSCIPTCTAVTGELLPSVSISLFIIINVLHGGQTEVGNWEV